MRYAVNRRSLAALLLLASGGLGCAPEESSTERIARQDSTDSVGTLTQFWSYAYDAAGVPSSVHTFTAAGVLSEITTYEYANGRRTGATTRAPGGTVLRSTAYSWSGAILDRATYYSSGGAVTNYSTYVFDAGGRKLVTHRYSALDAYLGRTEFEYDPVTHLRTGSTTYDAGGAVTGTSTRTYDGGLFVEAELGSTHRVFTYERGPLVGDPDVFFEF